LTTPLTHYRHQLDTALQAGNATEHTHRPALKTLLESLDLRLTATNEPRRVACGAPDYVITRDTLIVGLHLLESPAVRQHRTTYPQAGNNEIPNRGSWPKYTPPSGQTEGRVYINQTQYFAGVPEAVWEFQIGGYQVLHKWLKDRKGRALTYDDLTHYQNIIVALQETIHLMAEVDALISAWPLG
jgi:hypothetical protein